MVVHRDYNKFINKILVDCMFGIKVIHDDRILIKDENYKGPIGYERKDKKVYIQEKYLEYLFEKIEMERDLFHINRLGYLCICNNNSCSACRIKKDLINMYEEIYETKLEKISNKGFK